jgi:hypothetical protein
MIFDHRTYTCRPGTIKKHLKLYAEHGFGPQSRHLGKPLLYGIVETGDVNSYVHVWVYKDAADRAARRGAMAADPEWQAFLKLSAEAGNLVSQVNQIISPTEFYDMPEVG